MINQFKVMLDEKKNLEKAATDKDEVKKIQDSIK
jgi:hypothetical protein